MEKTTLIARYLTAVILPVYGLNTVLTFTPMGELPDGAQTSGKADT